MVGQQTMAKSRRPRRGWSGAPTGPGLLDTSLPAAPSSVPRARRLVERAARPLVSRETLDVVRLALDEALTQVLAHARGADRVRIAVLAGDSVEVRIEAAGGDPLPPGLRLHLVERLAERWGSDGEDGVRLWFSVPRWPNG